MNINSTIAAISSLLEINNDRIEGHATAAFETDESDLKVLFHLMAETSRKFNSDLIFEINKLDGTPAEGTSTTGKLLRVRMEKKTAIIEHYRKDIQESCMYG